MNCYLCGGMVFKVLMDFTEPDKYEKWMGITNVSRQWVMCDDCGFIQSTRNYPISEIEKIYKDGYRNPKFRGEPISSTFDKIMSLPNEKSENFKRCEWLKERIDPCSILDIGSGFGVFPVLINKSGFDVECVEENSISIDFINGMGFKCYDKIPDKNYEMISLIHVLEHIEDPIGFLKSIRKKCNRLFIEVPDASEFKYLKPENDEFNSCHLMFYTIESLIDVLERSGYLVTDIAKSHYEDRNLTRTWALCS